MFYYNEEEIKVCKNCHGYFPCLCDEKEYIVMDKWIYELMKKLNPVG